MTLRLHVLNFKHDFSVFGFVLINPEITKAKKKEQEILLFLCIISSIRPQAGIVI